MPCVLGQDGPQQNLLSNISCSGWFLDDSMANSYFSQKSTLIYLKTCIVESDVLFYSPQNHNWKARLRKKLKWWKWWALPDLTQQRYSWDQISQNPPHNISKCNVWTSQSFVWNLEMHDVTQHKTKFERRNMCGHTSKNCKHLVLMNINQINNNSFIESWGKFT